MHPLLEHCAISRPPYEQMLECLVARREYRMIEQLGLTCRRASAKMLPVSQWYPWMQKVGIRGVSALSSPVFFWNAAGLDASDIRKASMGGSLVTLYLNHNAIGDDGVRHIATCDLPFLRHLSVACNGITDAGAVQVVGISTLREVNLRGNHVTRLTRQALMRRHSPDVMFLSV